MQLKIIGSSINLSHNHLICGVRRISLVDRYSSISIRIC